ncbi:hypothetical protein HK101_000790 [Irineochytrium annulatum]|nr:hypothetical protein HK101_000790 [Irineochytrium annulatum]
MPGAPASASTLHQLLLDAMLFSTPDASTEPIITGAAAQAMVGGNSNQPAPHAPAPTTTATFFFDDLMDATETPPDERLATPTGDKAAGPESGSVYDLLSERDTLVNLHFLIRERLEFELQNQLGIIDARDRPSTTAWLENMENATRENGMGAFDQLPITPACTPPMPMGVCMDAVEDAFVRWLRWHGGQAWLHTVSTHFNRRPLPPDRCARCRQCGSSGQRVRGPPATAMDLWPLRFLRVPAAAAHPKALGFVAGHAGYQPRQLHQPQHQCLLPPERAGPSPYPPALIQRLRVGPRPTTNPSSSPSPFLRVTHHPNHPKPAHDASLPAVHGPHAIEHALLVRGPNPARSQQHTISTHDDNGPQLFNSSLPPASLPASMFPNATVEPSRLHEALPPPSLTSISPTSGGGAKRRLADQPGADKCDLTWSATRRSISHATIEGSHALSTQPPSTPTTADAQRASSASIDAKDLHLLGCTRSHASALVVCDSSSDNQDNVPPTRLSLFAPAAALPEPPPAPAPTPTIPMTYSPLADSASANSDSETGIAAADDAVAAGGDNKQPRRRKPFPCGVCGRAFARKHGRLRHEKLHAVPKAFTCAGCRRQYARADGLRRHMKGSRCGRVLGVCEWD